MSTNCVCHSLELYTATHSYHCPHILAILHVWCRHLHIYQDPIHTNYCHSSKLDTCSCILGFFCSKGSGGPLSTSWVWHMWPTLGGAQVTFPPALIMVCWRSAHLPCVQPSLITTFTPADEEEQHDMDCLLMQLKWRVSPAINSTTRQKFRLCSI